MCSLAFLVMSACTLIGGLSVCCPQRRYHVVRDVMTWDQARQHCQSNFIDLVSVPSEEEMLAVKALISRVSEYTFWLGLRRNTVSSPWEWSTGVAFQYSKWLSWEPDANGDCGVMIPTGEWGAEPCGNPQCFVCLAGPSALCGQREYFLVHTVKNADEAREHCRSLYTDLVSITSQDVLLDIEQLMNKDTSNTDYWIGLRRDGGSWSWGNGETFNYSNWGGFQLVRNGTCVTIKTSDWNFGTWQENNCNDINKFICYKDIQDTTTVQFDSSQTEDGEQQSQHPSTMASPSPPAAAGGYRVKWLVYGQGYVIISTDPQDTTTVQSDSQSSPTTGATTSQTPDGGEQSQQPSTMDSTSPRASSPGHSSSWLPGTSPAVTVTPIPEELHLISDSMVWPEAWQYCRDHYTDLVSLTSLAAQNRVSELVRNSTASRFWIGLHRTVVYDKWYWVAGKDKRAPLNYTNWAPGEPNNPYYEHCGEMVLGEDGGAEWNDLCCYEKLPFICFKG
ncbi:macrophage mannose receptor 1-like isoform X1 [Acipenser ruthenus]|uniref:macrophage mannose receptor 1-like isoform X1 n=1 Tax=Acipenser ruthenus TaxID=7906 RepID=UPI002740F05C|nr:macrophage mannose receptor 1-like isoform X1 [Acipenser ruthenus]